MSLADEVRRVALAAWDAGYAVLPAAEDGTKRPGVKSWTHYQHTRPDRDTVETWFANGRTGVGVLCGTVSGGLEMVELEGRGAHLWPRIIARADELGRGPLLERIINGYTEMSPSGGLHFHIRSPTAEGNLKLARTEAGEVLAETRGEGGFTIVAPSGGSVHPTGRAWQMKAGELAQVTVVDPDERAAFLDLFRYFNEYRTPDLPTPHVENDPWSRAPIPEGTGWLTDVIDDYNRRTRWHDVLEGWVLHHESAGVGYWTRPGKDPRDGTSATTNAKQTDRLIVFSSSVPGFEPWDGAGPATSYDRFSASVVLAHGVDSVDRRVAHARRLRLDGYGPPPGPEATVEATEATVAGLALRFVPDLADNYPAKPPMLVDGLMRAGEIVVVGAPRAIGKTWAAMQLAHLLAAGEGQFLGSLEVKSAANVLYLQGELDEWGSAERWATLTPLGAPLPGVWESFDRPRIKVFNGRLERGTDTGILHETVTEARLDERIAPTVEQLAETGRPIVIVVDPWAMFHGGNENSNDEVQAALAAMDDLRQSHGVTWVVIHHIGKARDAAEPEDLWRGASRLADWASMRVTFMPYYTPAQAEKKGMSRNEARRYLRITRLWRYGDNTPDLFVKRSDNLWFESWVPDAEQGGRPATVTQRDIVAWLIENGPAKSIIYLADTLDANRNRVSTLVGELVDNGTCELIPDPSGGRAKQVHLR